MDIHTLRTQLDAVDIQLFTLGTAVITVSSLLKLLLFGALLYMLAGRVSNWTLKKLLSHTRMDTGQQMAVMGLVHYAVLVVGAVLILQNAGINLTAFAIVASALGVGIGFGLQNIISNFISGLIIMLEQPIKVGDRIELAGVEGRVESIGARRTTVVTPDRIAILVPNQRFITDNVTNYVYFDRSIRLRVPLTVPRTQDVRSLQQLLLGAARAVQGRDDPKPQVTLTAYGHDTVGVEVCIWYDGAQFSKQEMASRLYFAVDDELRKAEPPKPADPGG